MTTLPEQGIDPNARRGFANYPGDVRDTEYIVGYTYGERSIMRAVDVTYDEATNTSRVEFVETTDPQWMVVLAQESWAQDNMHLMYPAFYLAPEAGEGDE